MMVKPSDLGPLALNAPMDVWNDEDDGTVQVTCALPRKERFCTAGLDEWLDTERYTLDEYLTIAAECFEEYARQLRAMAAGERDSADWSAACWAVEDRME